MIREDRSITFHTTPTSKRADRRSAAHPSFSICVLLRRLLWHYLLLHCNNNHATSIVQGDGFGACLLQDNGYFSAVLCTSLTGSKDFRRRALSFALHVPPTFFPPLHWKTPQTTTTYKQVCDWLIAFYLCQSRVPLAQRRRVPQRISNDKICILSNCSGNWKSSMLQQKTWSFAATRRTSTNDITSLPWDRRKWRIQPSNT